MNKKIKVGLGIAFVLLLVIIDIVKFTSVYKIDISNKADSTVRNLELRYKVNGTIKNISQLEPRRFWEYKIDTSELNGEDQILLTYKDKTGRYYEKYLVGYLEKGYRGNIRITINDIDDNGKLELNIE